MPLINVKLIEGVFSSDQKQQIIERLTDAMVSIEGENMRQVSGAWSRRSRAATGASRATPSRPSRSARSQRAPSLARESLRPAHGVAGAGRPDAAAVALEGCTGCLAAALGDGLLEEVVGLTGDLIRADTTNPPGNETRGAEVLDAYLRRNGVEAELVARDPARANLIARVRGHRHRPRRSR